MSTLTLPSYGFNLRIPNTTTLVACDDTTHGAGAIAPPDNCQTIVVYNIDGTNPILIKFDSPSTITMGSMTTVNSIYLPAASSRTFAVGFLGSRSPLGVSQPVNMYFKAVSGTNVDINVSYGMGSGRSLLG
jgi:hypothetical protein